MLMIVVCRQVASFEAALKPHERLRLALSSNAQMGRVLWRRRCRGAEQAAWPRQPLRRIAVTCPHWSRSLKPVFRLRSD